MSDDNASNAIKIAVGLVVTLLLISFIVVAVTSALKIGNNAMSQVSTTASNMTEQKYTQYDGDLVTGDQVIGIVKSFAQDHISIIVDGSGTYNWSEGDLQSPASDKIASAQIKGDSHYISPTAYYTGEIIRDEATDAIIALKFTRMS